jgi:poly(A) polymerase
MIKAFLRKVGLLSKNKEPKIISREKHKISRKHISGNALKVLYRLNQHGHSAYLVGGGVRDLLLGERPKDFDIVTDAEPEQVRQIFRNSRLIGRRFRLAHVYFGYDIVEVATFRGKAEEANEDHRHSEEGMILRDNVYGTIAEDVLRRDFTINALYYNIADFTVVDYMGGMADLKAKRLRMIGDPLQRFREDPVRMLRAIRFACKTRFELTQELKQAIRSLKGLITNVSSARLFEETVKMFHSGAAVEAYRLLKEEGLFEILFPEPAASLSRKEAPTDLLLNEVFENTDRRIKENKSVNPSFVIAALLWHPICFRAQQLSQNGHPFYVAQVKAIEEVLSRQIKQISLPKRISQAAREIWLLQGRLLNPKVRRLSGIMAEPRFRASYDFLELRAKAGEPVADMALWWREYIEGDPAKRKAMEEKMERQGPRKRKPPRKRKKSET